MYLQQQRTITLPRETAEEPMTSWIDLRLTKQKKGAFNCRPRVEICYVFKNEETTRATFFAETDLLTFSYSWYTRGPRKRSALHAGNFTKSTVKHYIAVHEQYNTPRCRNRIFNLFIQIY